MIIEFKEFLKLMQEHVGSKMFNGANLFLANVDKDFMWNLYLDSFPPGTNEIYIKRREHDCGCCRQFIKEFGAVIAVIDNKPITIWGFDPGDNQFRAVCEALDSYIKSLPIKDVYYSHGKRVGTQSTHQESGGKIITWDHFFLDIPSRFILPRQERMSEKTAHYRDTHHVFVRSITSISAEAVEAVLELISQNSLYKGEEWKKPLTDFLSLQQEYYEIDERIPDFAAEERECWGWVKAGKVGPVVGKIRNHSIGTLLTNITEGMELDAAVRAYESIVAPTNYKRPKPIFTAKMLDDAKQTLGDAGYLPSLQRRYATLSDIRVPDILFVNRDSAAKMADAAADVFSAMKKEVSAKPIQFSRVEEVPVEAFVSDVLPSAREISVYLQTRHEPNLVSLIAPTNPESLTMFKWNNRFSWAYSGNIADSFVKENVKSAGGKVDGVLRFSIQWNDQADHDGNDVDAHCIEPDGNRICFSRKHSHNTGGSLDVDITMPTVGKPAVENITWPSLKRMPDGRYEFAVHCYACRGGKSGFRAEIEFDGEIYSFDYSKPLRLDERIVVATVSLQDGKFSIKPFLDSSAFSTELWGLRTNQFVPVSTIMYSPNFWEGAGSVGHRHFFFMLKDCENPGTPNGWFNEYLKNDLDKHKRVMEALGGNMQVAHTPDQLSGLGFSATKRNDLFVKVDGASSRVIKVVF